jgi:predicted HNH restriction endonuclease
MIVGGREMYINDLRKIKDISKENFSNANLQFSRNINSFLNNLNIIEESKFRVKTSIGMGTMAKLWWCTIMDRKFYKDVYGVHDDRSLSADKGYYIAYLFNEEKTKLFLCISQPSNEITKKKNLEKYKLYIEKNKVIYNELYSDSKYHRLPSPTLSSNELIKAREFEASIIIYKEYILSENISDNEFLNDLKKFIEIYNQLLKYIVKTKFVIIKNTKLSLFTNEFSQAETDFDFIELIEEEKLQVKSYESLKYLSGTELEDANNRDVEYGVIDGLLRYKRDARIQKTVIENSNYLCNFNSSHQTFLTKNGNKFMEGHHLVPLKYQHLFASFRLDRSENIESLCPICHSAIHYGSDEEKRIKLETLYNKSKMKIILKKHEVNSFIEFYDKFYL